MPHFDDIEYLIRFFASTYGNCCNTLNCIQEVGEYLQYDQIDEDVSESLLRWCQEADTQVENNSVMATAALESLVEIKQSMSEDEWNGYLLKIPEVLKPLDADMARYEALLAFQKAGLPMPDENDPGVFVFGQFNEESVTSEERS